jgi:hypothetical protein
VGGLDGVALSEELLDELSLDNALSTGHTGAVNLNGAESRQGTAMIRSMSRDLQKHNSELERVCKKKKKKKIDREIEKRREEGGRE